MNPSFKKTVLATLVAGSLGGAMVSVAEANVALVSFKGAFTMLNATGSTTANSPSDYVFGTYGATGTASGPATTYGWKGVRTPITGTMSFDTSTGAGVATVTPFLFFGNSNAHYANAVGISFQAIDTVGTLVGGMLFSWNVGSHSVSIVLDAGQMFAALPAMIGGGPTTTVAGTYSALSNTAPLMTLAGAITTAIARTSSINTGAGCDGLAVATQVNPYTINTNFTNLGTCTTGMSDDGVAGDPMTSTAFSNYNGNFDILSVHFDAYIVPVPAAVWLFGSGLVGLVGIARRKKKSTA